MQLKYLSLTIIKEKERYKATGGFTRWQNLKSRLSLSPKTLGLSRAHSHPEPQTLTPRDREREEEVASGGNGTTMMAAESRSQNPTPRNPNSSLPWTVHERRQKEQAAATVLVIGDGGG